MKGGIWRFCGELQEQLHRNLPTEKGQALVGAAVGGVEAMLGSVFSQEGFLTQSSTCKLQQEIPQLFLYYLLMLLLSSFLGTLFFPVLPCSWTAVFQIRSFTDYLAKFHASALCSSFPCPLCLPGA